MLRSQGFTLIELMVALVAGSIAAAAAFSLSAGISRQFFEQQRASTSQGNARNSLTELKRDISRAGLFGTPNASKERTCDVYEAELPLFDTGTYTPIQAFQYDADRDTGILDDNDMSGTNSAANPGVVGDRLRILVGSDLTDTYIVDGINSDGLYEEVVLDTNTQGYKRTFLWGMGRYGNNWAFLKGAPSPDGSVRMSSRAYLGFLDRSLLHRSILHFESPSGAHFFRFKQGGTADGSGIVSVKYTPGLPVNTTCIPGNGQGMSVSSLRWVEYGIFRSPILLAYDPEHQMWDGSMTDALGGTWFAPSDVESVNPTLVKQTISPTTGSLNSKIAIVAEFVSNFQVSFLVDMNSGTGAAPDIRLISGDGTRGPEFPDNAEDIVNNTPERVRSVIIDLSVRSSVEDKKLTAGNDAGTRFNVDPNALGMARVQRLRIEVPVPNVGRRNL